MSKLQFLGASALIALACPIRVLPAAGLISNHQNYLDVDALR